MAYPQGLETRNVTFGKAVVLESGQQLDMRVTIKASRSLVHRPTGSPLITTSSLFISAYDGDGSIMLPVCDSQEMGTGNGMSLVLGPGEVTHTYTATIEYLDPTDHRKTVSTTTRKDFVVLSSSPSPVDLDDLMTPDAVPASGTPTFLAHIAETADRAEASAVSATTAHTGAAASAASAAASAELAETVVVEGASAVLTAELQDEESLFGSAFRTVLADELDDSGLVLESSLEAQYGPVWLPPPSGGDDTAAFQAALLEAQSSSGTVRLHPGTYKVAGLVTTQSFVQPSIVGSGADQTIVEVSGTNAAIRLTGGSGTVTRAIVSDLTVRSAGGAGIGIELRDCGGVSIERVKFRDLAVGLLFHNYQAGAFTEFNVAKDCFFSTSVKMAGEYRRGAGNDSFHGSGFRDCFIEQPANATGPSIKVGPGCRVYNAPWDVSFFCYTPTQPLIQSLGLPPTTTGTIRVEGAGLLIGSNSTAEILHTGSTHSLSASFDFGRDFYLCSQVQANVNGTWTYSYEQQTTDVAGAAGTPVPIADLMDGSYLVSVHLDGANYVYDYLLHVWRNRFNDGGTVTVLANPSSNNTAAWGPPTFTVSGYQLRVAGNYPANAVKVFTHIKSMGTRRGDLFQT